MASHFVIYSHGFGARKDDGGIFTSIAEAYPDTRHIMTDLNDVDEVSNTITVASLDTQIKKLRGVVDNLLLQDEDTLDIIAHSQGCAVAALLHPKVRNIILLAPPHNVNVERVVAYFRSRITNLDLGKDLTIPRRDGSTTIIPPVYWESIKGLDLVNAYNQLANDNSVTVVLAGNDEVLGKTDFSGLVDTIKVDTIDCDHNFSGQAREQLIKLLAFTF